METQERERLNSRLALALRQLDTMETNFYELATFVTSVSVADHTARRNPNYLHELAQRITGTHLLFSIIQADIAYLAALLRGEIEDMITASGEERIITTLSTGEVSKITNVSIVPDGERKENIA